MKFIIDIPTHVTLVDEELFEESIVHLVQLFVRYRKEKIKAFGWVKKEMDDKREKRIKI